MTKPRYDSFSTEFGLWLRDQEDLDSRSQGFSTTNLDYIWENYKTGQFMLIEEKRYNSCLKFPQSKTFENLHRRLVGAEGYCGFFFIKFEKTSPEDGRIFVCEFFKQPRHVYELSSEELIRFLRFEKIEDIVNERAASAATPTAHIPNTQPSYQAESNYEHPF